MELPSVDGGVETRTRTRLRQHGCAQTRRTDAAVHPVLRQPRQGSRLSGRRGQHRKRPRPHRRLSARLASGRRQDRVHGQHTDRARDHEDG